MPGKNIIGGILLLSISIVFGCESEAEKDNLAQQIIGYWEVTQAMRNQQPTTTLEDAYFEFLPDKIATLNLNGTDQSGTFTAENKSIKIEGTFLEGDFEVLKLQNDSMILSTNKELRGIDYHFIFQMLRRDSIQLEEI